MTVSIENWAEQVRAGDVRAISRAVSAIENRHREAEEILRQLFPHTGSAYRVEITGAPGTGKSTLVDRLASHYRAEKKTVGIIAVDPSSPFTGGAILGDRIRMQGHATDPGVFIRSMATRGHLGGLALATPQAVRVLDAVGTPWVIVETVGVGQVEVEVAGAADTTVVVVNPGWGDGVQANKAGLLEIADLLVMNKADRPGRDETVSDLHTMLAMSSARDWTPPVLETVATTGQGIDELWASIAAHRAHLEHGDELVARRDARLRDELRAIVADRLGQRAAAVCDGPAFDELVARVAARDLDPHAAATALLDSSEAG